VSILKFLIISSIIASCSTYHVSKTNKTTNKTRYIQKNKNNQIYDPIYESTVSLERTADYDGELMTIVATGVVIKNIEGKKQKINSYILSVEHFCKKIKNKVTAMAVSRDDETLVTFKGKVLFVDQESDLCLIKLYNTKNRFESIRFSNELPKIGERVMVIGSPEGIFPSKTEGYVISNTFGSYNEDKDLYMTVPVSGGSSGSPVYNEDFELVGILKARHIEFGQISIAVPLDKINIFLDNCFSK
tara:strand:- start:1187 stop:1921 length:735 start_codon:yes stop_codon:yes gene_type:complete